MRPRQCGGGGWQPNKVTLVRSPLSGLPPYMLQVAAHATARAAPDDRAQEQSFEASHPVVARSRDRNEG